jgi:hypothetical protein
MLCFRWLNEKALEAVRKYKFKPAMLDGKMPFPVAITVEVSLPSISVRQSKWNSMFP